MTAEKPCAMTIVGCVPGAVRQIVPAAQRRAVRGLERNVFAHVRRPLGMGRPLRGQRIVASLALRGAPPPMSPPPRRRPARDARETASPVGQRVAIAVATPVVDARARSRTRKYAVPSAASGAVRSHAVARHVMPDAVRRRAAPEAGPRLFQKRAHGGPPLERRAGRRSRSAPSSANRPTSSSKRPPSAAVRVARDQIADGHPRCQLARVHHVLRANAASTASDVVTVASSGMMFSIEKRCHSSG